MTDAPAARPSRRIFWADARFILGIVLIAASVAGVFFVVAAARQTTPAYAAARTIVPGEAITSDDLRVVEVALGALGDTYLTPDDVGASMVAARTIAEGELVPAGAVGDAAAARTTTVVVRSTVDVPAAVVAGTVVEVWSAPLVEHGVYDDPRILVPDATVVSVTRDDATVGGAEAAVELVIARSDVAAVLAAIGDGSALSVVPTAGVVR